MTMDTALIWLGAILTFAVWSQLFRETPFYRYAEHATVGITAGHMVVMGWRTFNNVGISPLVDNGEYLMLIPLGLGVLLLARLYPKLRHWSKIPVAVLIGVGIGSGIRGQMQSNLVGQIRATLLSLDTVENILIVAGVAFGLLVFYFTKTNNRAIYAGTLVGRAVIMAALGASFASAVMNRVAILLGRVQFLLWDWLQIGV